MINVDQATELVKNHISKQSSEIKKQAENFAEEISRLIQSKMCEGRYNLRGKTKAYLDFPRTANKDEFMKYFSEIVTKNGYEVFESKITRNTIPVLVLGVTFTVNLNK